MESEEEFDLFYDLLDEALLTILKQNNFSGEITSCGLCAFAIRALKEIGCPKDIALLILIKGHKEIYED